MVVMRALVVGQHGCPPRTRTSIMSRRRACARLQDHWPGPGVRLAARSLSQLDPTVRGGRTVRPALCARVPVRPIRSTEHAAHRSRRGVGVLPGWVRAGRAVPGSSPSSLQLARIMTGPPREPGAEVTSQHYESWPCCRRYRTGAPRPGDCKPDPCLLSCQLRVVSASYVCCS